MTKLKKLFPIFLLALFLFFGLTSFVLAQEGRELEIEYPSGFGEAPVTVKTSLEQYVKYIFNFSVMIAGLIAFAALVYGGFRYLTSAGNPAAIADAKDQIFAAFLGLIILLCSYLILVTINPQLAVMKITRAPLCNCEKPKSEWPWPPDSKEYKACEEYCKQLTDPFRNFGVYLITDDYDLGAREEKCIPDVEKSDCLRILGDISDLGIYGFNDKAKKIKFSNPEISELGAILHEDKDFQDQCRIFFERAGEEFQNIPGEDNLGKISKPSSATIFLRKEASEGYVTLCSDPDFTGDCKTFSAEEIGAGFDPQSLDKYGLDNNVRSIKIEGKHLVVLFEKPPGGGFPGKCEVFRVSDSDLKDNPIGRCELQCLKKFWGICYWWGWGPCASAIAIYPGR